MRKLKSLDEFKNENENLILSTETLDFLNGGLSEGCTGDNCTDTWKKETQATSGNDGNGDSCSDTCTVTTDENDAYQYCIHDNPDCY